MNNERWEGMQAETEQVRLHNEPTGVPIILRRFEFNAPPGITNWPTKKEIAEIHQKGIELFLWGDELQLVAPLRVKLDKKNNKFDIFAPCQPRRGSEILEKPITLQDIVK